MLETTGLGHVALRVRDLDQALAFYTGKLGFAEMLRLNRDDGSLALVYLRITDTDYLELFPGGTDERAPPSERTGYNHLCLTVDSLERTLAGLAAAGVPLSQGPKRAADGNLQAWIEDP